MAPEVANQKRKRGRPTNASRDDGDGDGDASGSQLRLTRQGELATAAENTRESDVDESSRPRKRGRPANTEAPSQAEASQPPKAKKKRVPLSTTQPNDSRDDERNEEPEAEAEPEPEPEPENVPRKKRGRPRISNEIEQTEEHDNTNTTSENVPPKKRGRPRLSDEAEQTDGNSVDVTSQNMAPKKRGRPPKGVETGKDNEIEADEADDENEDNSSFLRRSGRVRRSPDTTNKGAQRAAEPTGEQSSNSQKPKEGGKRGRPRLSEPAAAETEQESIPQPKKKRGRPSLNDRPPADTETNPEPQVQPKKRGRPSLNGEHATSTKEKRKKPRDQPSPDQQEEASEQEEVRPARGKPRLSDKEPQPRQGKHRRSSDNQDRSSSPDSEGSPPRYRHLTTRTRRVPRNVIESKWTPLEATAISSVTTLLQSASRPVLLRLNNPQRHAHAATALNAVSNRLRSKIARGLPFPPATTSTRREEEFEFERTISGIQSLESQLDPLLHSVELLRREQERADKELEREYKVLSRLSTNAHAEARERRTQMRKMHVLVPEPSEPKPEDVGGDILTPEKGIGKVFSGLQDEALVGLAGQIANHMESMRGNLQQMDDVVPEITKTQGLLRATLQSHLDREQLENVILG